MSWDRCPSTSGIGPEGKGAMHSREGKEEPLRGRYISSRICVLGYLSTGIGILGYLSTGGVDPLKYTVLDI